MTIPQTSEEALDELMRLGDEMRRLQRAYFAARKDPVRKMGILMASKKAEKEYDDYLYILNNKFKNGKPIA